MDFGKYLFHQQLDLPQALSDVFRLLLSSRISRSGTASSTKVAICSFPSPREKRSLYAPYPRSRS